MMARSLLIVGAAATVGLAAAAGVAYLALEFTHHLLLALVSSLLALFAHSWVVLYLAATGRAIRDVVREHSLEPEIMAEVRGLKRRSLPWVLVAMALWVATFIAGGGVYVRLVPPWAHHGLFWVTLVVQGWTLWRERGVLRANEGLMATINQRLWA